MIDSVLPIIWMEYVPPQPDAAMADRYRQCASIYQWMAGLPLGDGRRSGLSTVELERRAIEMLARTG